MRRGLSDILASIYYKLKKTLSHRSVISPQASTVTQPSKRSYTKYPEYYLTSPLELDSSLAAEPLPILIKQYRCRHECEGKEPQQRVAPTEMQRRVHTRPC